MQKLRIENLYGMVEWRSPSNIALIKYWGNKGDNLPRNPSISFSLKNSYTQTKISYKKKKNKNFDFYFEDKKNKYFADKINNFLKKAKKFIPILDNLYLKIESSNSFPHSSGIASSASSMSALALCLCSIEKEISKKKIIDKDFYQKASKISRIGSGSAARSLYPGFATWGKSKIIRGSSDQYAIIPSPSITKNFQKINDAILIISSEVKKTSSLGGHTLMNESPYASSRFRDVNNSFEDLIRAMKNNNKNKFVEIIEREALCLHAMMMTSQPSYTLLKPNSLEIITRIQNFREKTGINICFTFDAGPNVHLIYFDKDKRRVVSFINRELKKYCERGKWIDDRIGEGPEEIIRV